MPRCLNCKDKFEKKYPNQQGKFRFCLLKDECITAFNDARKEKQISTAKQQRTEYNKKHSKNPLNYLQDEINKLSKMIDESLGFTRCIDCNNKMDLIHAAHLHNVQGNENIRFNLHNLHSARAHCNMYSSEHKVGYRKGLELRYSAEYLNYVDNDLKLQYSYLGLKANEIADALKITREIIRNFDTYKFTGGVEARDMLNDLIGIYKNKTK